MNQKAILCAAAFAVGLVFSADIPGWADDSAASIAAGGLVPRRETRIAMAKEVLRISPEKVVVDYDFRNDTEENVTTEVAFPVPPYAYDFDGPMISLASFSDFQLLVDGKRVAFQAQARATLSGKDVTEILSADRIDIPTFGHLRETSEPAVEIHTPDIERLSKPEQKRLTQMGLFGKDRPWGTWTVHLQYHWTQTFPAHSTIHIRHEYTPTAGFQMVGLEEFQRAVLAGKARAPKPLANGWPRESYDQLMSFCPEPSFLRGAIQAIENYAPSSDANSYPEWVDFILTSANTWKQPIEDFTLIIERGTPLDGYGKPMKDRIRLISFCSPQNATVDKLDADHFQVHLTNFVPTSELHIGFFELPVAKSPQN